MKTRTLVVLMFAVAFALGMTASACSSAQEPSASDQAANDSSIPSGYVTLGVKEAYQQLSSNAEAQILDVREPSEWTASGVPVGAVLIPLGDLEKRAPAELAQSDPVYVICNSGNRSQTGSQILIDLGYAEVYNVDGGIQAWLAAGLPVESYAP